ncbi:MULTISPECIES: hypothetical protein [Streptomyces]|uniref:Uncharacterized protein n=1 Tax=Streptomyces ramulosus TaxID=47762 RepID=A0ABW1FPR6_9ACTN
MNTDLDPFRPFPELPSALAEYVAARAAEEVPTGPSPWDIGALPEDLRGSLDDWLGAVCRWLNRTYAWQPHQVIPPCWSEHEGLAYEVASLAFARSDAFSEAVSSVVWHEQCDRFIARMNAALGRAGDACRSGRHDDRPARFQLAAWPRRAMSDPLAAQEGAEGEHEREEHGESGPVGFCR